MTKPCVVPKCKTGYKTVREKCSVFKVPSDIERCKKWQAAIPGIVHLKPSQYVYVVTGGSNVMHVDESESVDFKSPDDGVFTVQVASIERTQSQEVQDPPLKCPANVNVNIEISPKVSMNECISTVHPNSENAEKFPFAVPSPWGVSTLAGSAVGTIVLSLFVPKIENGVEIPVMQKNATISIDRTLRFFVYGRAINAQDCQLAQMLDDTKQLPEILEKFRNVSLCHGLGAINVHHVSADSAFKDQVDAWRSKDCTMICKRKRCDACMKMRQSVLKNETRSKTRPQLYRISRASNPVDHRKILALRKKNLYQRRQKVRAKRHVELLQQSLKERANQISSIRAETLDARCLGLNIPPVQKNALREIISAAYKKDAKNRRYDEESIMLCLLMCS